MNPRLARLPFIRRPFYRRAASVSTAPEPVSTALVCILPAERRTLGFLPPRTFGPCAEDWLNRVKYKALPMSSTSVPSC
jgi:hypothetical protein